MTYTIEHVLSVQNELGEGPIWQPEEGRLYWIDIVQGHIHRYAPASGDHQRYELPPPVGCLAFRADGGFLAARDSTIDAWSLDSGLGETIARFDPAEIGERFNDGAVDPQGRFWIGSMSDSGTGGLYRLGADRAVQRMKPGIGVGNGIGWSPDRRRMYFTDSARSTIWVYDFDPDTGDIANERVFAAVSGPGEGLPDGLTVDVEGTIWGARWDGWKIVRYAPDGRILTEIPVPVQRPTSCVFGGENLDVLYITSARIGLDPGQLDSQPLAGDVFCLQTDTQGSAEPRYAG
jgi:L-arabinonolactonase